MWYNSEMIHKRTLQRVFGAVLLAAAGAVMIWQLYTILVLGMIHVASGLLLIAMVCAPLFLGVFLLARSFTEPTAQRKVVRTSLAVLFGFYLVALASELILSRIDFLHFSQAAAQYRENFDLMTNFRPFETVLLYLRALKYNYIGPTIPLSNLLGNMLLFMPMAVFLPCLFRTMQKFWVFALVMLGMLVMVEALQLLLSCGSCDVDDVLLNLTGTFMVYGILKIPLFKRLLARLSLLPEPKTAPSPEPEAGVTAG